MTKLSSWSKYLVLVLRLDVYLFFQCGPYLFCLKLLEFLFSPEILFFAMHTSTIASMVSFVEEKGGCVDWGVFSVKFKGVKVKSMHNFFEIKNSGQNLEVRNKKPRRRSTHVASS